MIFEQIRVGGDRNFAYLIGDENTGSAAVIDPAYSPETVLDLATKRNLRVRYLVNTHGHHDHAGGNEYVQAHTDARLVHGGPGGVADRETLTMGSVEMTFLHTPGHTPDSICVLIRDSRRPEEPAKLVTGDTLFVGKVGGTDLGEGARREYESLHRQLMTLPDETEVWPGHDVGVAPSSTIGHEKKTNPFLLQPDVDAFVDLKRNWAEYKRKHGIA